MSTSGEMRWDVLTYLCVEELTALSCTRRRRVVFNPGNALGTARVETKGGNKAIRMHAQNQCIAESCNTTRGPYATGLMQYAAMVQWALKVVRPVKGYCACRGRQEAPRVETVTDFKSVFTIPLSVVLYYPFCPRLY